MAQAVLCAGPNRWGEMPGRTATVIETLTAATAEGRTAKWLLRDADI